LHRWRETFAEKLRGWGIDAEASRQASRGVDRNCPSLWRQKAAAKGRERHPRPDFAGQRLRCLESVRQRNGPRLRGFHRKMVRGRSVIRDLGNRPVDRRPESTRDTERTPRSRCRARYLGARGSWREDARSCLRGRRASRMSRNSPSVVSGLSGFDDACREERPLRPQKKRPTSKAATAARTMTAGITLGRAAVDARL